MNETKKINYGIEIGKIIAMLMVIILHILFNGGIIENTDVGSLNYYLGWLIFSLAGVAVNVYAMCSGYVYVNSKYHFSRIIYLWFKVIVYSLIIGLIFNLFINESFDVKTFIMDFFPIIFRKYWYFSAYVLLFLLIPFLNIGLKRISKKGFLWLIIILVSFYSCFNIIALFHNIAIFDSKNGYSALWLIIMYIIGYYIGKHGSLLKNKRIIYLIGYFLIMIINGFLAILFRKILPNVYGHIMFIYNSPLNVLGSILLFKYFTLLNPKNQVINKTIKTISQTTFGVYIIHVNHYIFKDYLKNLFKDLALKNSVIMIMEVVAFALIIFIICSIIDYLFTLIFKLIKIPILCDIVGRRFDNFINKEVNYE